jgi:hypothetical protein
MRWLFATVALVSFALPSTAAPISYRSAFIVYCQGSFANGPCTTVASSSGSAISSSGTVATSGETVTYTASSAALAGPLGGKVSVSSNTFNATGPGVMVDAVAQFVDSVTISFAPWNGSGGTMFLYYTLDGTNSASGTGAGATFGPHGVPYACVKAGINNPILPFGCTAYDQASVGGLFYAGAFNFTYGVAFPLWFQLENIAGTGFGPGRPTGVGTSVADFFNTATIAGFGLYGPNMQPLTEIPNIASDLGVSYKALAVPEPTSMALLAAGLLAIRRRTGRGWS